MLQQKCHCVIALLSAFLKYVVYVEVVIFVHAIPLKFIDSILISQSSVWLLEKIFRKMLCTKKNFDSNTHCKIMSVLLIKRYVYRFIWLKYSSKMKNYLLTSRNSIYTFFKHPGINLILKLFKFNLFCLYFENDVIVYFSYQR